MCDFDHKHFFFLIKFRRFSELPQSQHVHVWFYSFFINRRTLRSDDFYQIKKKTLATHERPIALTVTKNLMFSLCKKKLHQVIVPQLKKKNDCDSYVCGKIFLEENL